jgi:hypothetical protein
MPGLSPERPSAYITRMSSDPRPRATKRPDGVRAPTRWTNTPPPRPARVDLADDPLGTDPVRYGDWERNGIAIDF